MGKVVEKATVIRAVVRLVSSIVHSDSDLKDISMRLYELAWDIVVRGRIDDCYRRHDYDREIFCCILNVLELPELWRKYCRWCKLRKVVGEYGSILVAMLSFALVGGALLILVFLPMIITSLLYTYSNIDIPLAVAIVAEVLWIPIVAMILIKIGDWLHGRGV
jgi:hypothetical protein